MLLFWKIYFICLGIAIFFSLFTVVCFTADDGTNIPLAYLLLAIFVCAIPGAGMLATLLLIIGIIGSVINADLIPRKFQ